MNLNSSDFSFKNNIFIKSPRFFGNLFLNKYKFNGIL